MGRKKSIIPNVQVIDIGDKGHAIGKTESGEICLIQEGPVPGDVVDFLYLRKKKGLKFGVVKDYISKSKDRVKPFCSHFEYCGGCKWQHLSYDKQSDLKEAAVKNAIKRIAHDDSDKVNPIVKSEKLEAYRNKLEYTFSTKRWLTPDEIASDDEIEKRDGLGFHIAGAFDKVLDIDKCHLQDDFTNQVRNTFRRLAKENAWSFYDIRANKGLLRNIMIRNTTDNSWMVMVIFGENNKTLIADVMKNMTSHFKEVDSWYYMINTKANSSTTDLEAVHYAGETHITETLISQEWDSAEGVKYRISPKSFFQTNSYQASRLYDVAVNFAHLTGDEIVYDLYTGTGSIALYIAHHAARVVGIEVIPEAIVDANINAELNSIDNVDFLVGDVKDILKVEFKDQYGSPDVLITDPPRAGMHEEVIKTLLEIAAPKIVYISCNPSTQARDILLLKERYDLVKVTPVDMFPHTSHIESVALLVLK